MRSRQYPPNAVAMRNWLSLDDDMGDAVLRLLQALRRPVDAVVLGPGILRELLYRVLTGPQGAAVRAAVATREACEESEKPCIGSGNRMPTPSTWPHSRMKRVNSD
jgi:hypothetical protein